VSQIDTGDVSPDPTLAPAPTRRQSVIEYAIAVIAGMITTTLVSTALPVSFRAGTVDLASIAAVTNPISVILPVFVGFIAPFLVAMVPAVVIVEGRRPWPFGPRAQRPRERNWEVFPALLAGFVAQESIRQNTETTTRLYLEGDRYLWIGIPAGFGAALVAWLAVFSITFVFAHLIHTAFLARKPGATSPSASDPP
jgi:hypothetical protein